MRLFFTFLFLATAAMLMSAVDVQAETVLGNVAAFQPADGSFAYGMPPERAVNEGVYQYFHGGNVGAANWWTVDLGQAFDIDHLVLQLPSANPSVGPVRLNGATLMAFDADWQKVADNWVITGFQYDPEELEGGSVSTITVDNGGVGYLGVRHFQIGGIDPTDPEGPSLGVNYMCIGDFKSYAQIEKYPYFIDGVTATATDPYVHPGVSPDFVLDHSGMTDQRGPLLGDPNALHRPLFGVGLWHTTNNLEATKSITFDLGDTYDLDKMVVWNQHQGQENRAVKDCLIEVSTDGESWITLPDTNGEELGNYTLSDLLEATGPFSATDHVDMSGVTASRVRITALSSYGASLAYVGLSEVRFYQVPEPSSAALLVFALASLLSLGRSAKK